MSAAIVANTVTTTLKKVAVEHPHPNAFVLSSNLSSREGHVPAFETGSSREETGTQAEL